MKNIEEIQNMSLEALEEIADDQSVKAPASLNGRLQDAMAASSLKKEKNSGRRVLYGACGALAVAAASVAVVVSLPTQPKDTFTDPLLAYAELEKTFSYISSKVDMGLDIVEDAEPAMEMTSNIIDKINNR